MVSPLAVVVAARDQLDDGPVGDERPPSPVHRDEAEHLVLDLVPFRSSGREVAHRDVQSGALGEPRQLDLAQHSVNPCLVNGA